LSSGRHSGTTLIPAVHTNGLNVDAASLGLPSVVGTSVASGSCLNAATAREPVAVLGALAGSGQMARARTRLTRAAQAGDPEAEFSVGRLLANLNPRRWPRPAPPGRPGPRAR